MRTIHGIKPFKSDDPDSSRIFWQDGGVHRNLTFPVQPDFISGQVRIAKPAPDDKYENFLVGAYRVIYGFGEGNGTESWIERFKAERAWEWIASDDREIGSFCWICESLDLDAVTIRRRSKRYQDKRSERRRLPRLNCDQSPGRIEIH